MPKKESSIIYIKLVKCNLCQQQKITIEARTQNCICNLTRELGVINRMVNISTSPFAENNLSSASSNFALPFTPNEKLTLSIYVGVVSFAGTIGNILVIICILNQDINFSVAENPTNCLLLSQAVADLLVSCLSGPTYILAIFEPKRRFRIDSLARFTAAASIGNLALLTLNRFISIYSSFKYPRIVTPSRTKAAIALSWMISLIFGILADVEHRTNVRQLGEILKFYITLSLVAISGCHMYMYKKARYHKKEIKRLTYRPTGYHGGLEKDLQSVLITAHLWNFFCHLGTVSNLYISLQKL